MPHTTHSSQLETEAIKSTITHLQENWLIHSKEESDYGVDLILEKIDSNAPTSEFICVQIKATDSAFENGVQLSEFPVSRINYALMLNVPFFVFYTSNLSKETKFVCLQKYVETKLNNTCPNWKNLETVTISFPDENDLRSNEKKIFDIIQEDKFKKTGVKFLMCYELLVLYSQQIVSGEHQYGRNCAELVEKIINMPSFMYRYGFAIRKEYVNLQDLPRLFTDIAAKNSVSSEEQERIEECKVWFMEIKYNFLLADAEKSVTALPY